jgi:hypothetical protein
VNAINWQAVGAIDGVLSTVAIIAGTIFIIVQLLQAKRALYYEITSRLFQIWQGADFQRDQILLLRREFPRTWEEFLQSARGKRAEFALNRVGSFYERIARLIANGLLDEDEVLPSIGGYAISVWEIIEPIVREIRRNENALFLLNFEALIPECRRRCVPVRLALGKGIPMADPPAASAQVDRRNELGSNDG